jgi:YgiT-type zinc finger domain-containing protein
LNSCQASSFENRPHAKLVPAHHAHGKPRLGRQRTGAVVNKDRFVFGKCPVCGAGELVHDTRYPPYTYKGETATIFAVTANFCPACYESITGMAETARVMREMQSFNKQVNSGHC